MKSIQYNLKMYYHCTFQLVNLDSSSIRYLLKLVFWCLNCALEKANITQTHLQIPSVFRAGSSNNFTNNTTRRR